METSHPLLFAHIIAIIALSQQPLFGYGFELCLVVIFLYIIGQLFSSCVVVVVAFSFEFDRTQFELVCVVLIESSWLCLILDLH